jgi:hypothetical protein
VAKVGTVRILYRVGTISHQAAVHPRYMLGALNMKERKNMQHTAIDLQKKVLGTPK